MAVSDLVLRNSERYLDWLAEACSLPSLAEEPDGLAQMCAWLEERFTQLGATTERLTYETAPDALLVEFDARPKTVLFYNHYDVQPVDPLELWTSKPFSPEIRDGALYARGAADNKGDLVARIAALDAYLELNDRLPVGVKFLVEGEEESGSKSFEAMVSRYGYKLGADGCIWEGAGIDHAGRPELVFGAKGLAYVELNYRGLKEDQHSSLAVVAPSPVWHLIEALSTLRARDGRVLIDGFYDDVVPPSEEDEVMLADYPFEEDAEKARLGVEGFMGDVGGVDFLKRYFFEPTCNIAGIEAGFTVPGASKTVLPKEAMAKIDMRLVPEQDPDDVVAKLRRHLQARGYGDIDITTYSMEHPVRTPIDSTIGRAAVAAAERVFTERPAVSPMMIATGPMYPIARTVGIPTVSPAGVHRPDSNIHAPNENCRVEDFLRIAEYTAALLDEFASTET